MLSTKYSTETLESWLVSENVTSSRMGWLERMSAAPSPACAADNAMTTGCGLASCTELARPGVGPVASGEASQLAGSLAGQV